uniref:Ig-like domain-containing protein n=1 Tax=Chelonoidis abingdonii TaxID=106734 RepID=A0A8C0GYR0_CHEAB
IPETYGPLFLPTSAPRVSLSLSLAGCWAVTGPGAVRGPAGGSVAVRCRYQAGYEDYPKFWCREGGLIGLFCSDGVIVQTDGSEAEATRGRVSIRDDRTQRVFTVTVENLTPADASTYLCGVRRDWLIDLRDAVELTVSPGKSRRAALETPRPALAPGNTVSAPRPGRLVTPVNNAAGRFPVHWVVSRCGGGLQRGKGSGFHPGQLSS